MKPLGNDWDNIIGSEFAKEYYLNLREFLKYEYSHTAVFPPMNDIYNALRLTPYSEVRAVIIGQDPYHGVGQAHGLCFSVKRGVEAPPSLKNIYKELYTDLGITPPSHGELTSWAKNGVLLLNTTLTVRQGAPTSHVGKGWEIFTDKVIEKLNVREKPLVFILWGSNARRKKALITSPRHLILESAHPSPLSAYNGFFGCRHFSKTNEFLISQGLEPIDWRIEE